MPLSQDPCQIVGGHVIAKAVHITSLAKFSLAVWQQQQDKRVTRGSCGGAVDKDINSADIKHGGSQLQIRWRCYKVGFSQHSAPLMEAIEEVANAKVVTATAVVEQQVDCWDDRCSHMQMSSYSFLMTQWVLMLAGRPMLTKKRVKDMAIQTSWGKENNQSNQFHATILGVGLVCTSSK